MAETKFGELFGGSRIEGLANVEQLFRLFQRLGESFLPDAQQLLASSGAQERGSVEAALGGAGLTGTGTGAALQSLTRSAVGNRLALARANLFGPLLGQAGQLGFGLAGQQLQTFGDLRQSELANQLPNMLLSALAGAAPFAIQAFKGSPQVPRD